MGEPVKGMFAVIGADSTVTDAPEWKVMIGKVP